MKNFIENGQPSSNDQKNGFCEVLVKYLDNMNKSEGKLPMLLQGKDAGIKQTSHNFADPSNGPN